MRRTPLLIAAVSLVAAATPAALLAHPSDGPKDKAPGNHPPEKADGPKEIRPLFLGCVTADATETGVDVSVLAGNRAARKSLDGATTFTATLNTDTRIRLVGKGRKAEDGRHGKRLPRIGTWADLDAGDLVMVRYRAVHGTLVADLGPARKVVDFGQRPRWCPVAAPKDDAPPTTTAPTTTAPAA